MKHSEGQSDGELFSFSRGAGVGYGTDIVISDHLMLHRASKTEMTWCQGIY